MSDPKKKKSDARSTRTAVKYRLMAECMGYCTFPDCREQLTTVNEDSQNSAQFCHIRGREPDAARYDDSYTEDIDDYPNLIVMCYKHHHYIDDQLYRAKYSADELIKLKLNRAKAGHDFFRTSSLGEPVMLHLDHLLGKLLDETKLSFEIDFSNTSITQKIALNGLPQDQSNWIVQGLQARGQIENYLDDMASLDPSIPERMKRRVQALYAGLLADGVLPAEIYPNFITIFTRNAMDCWPAANSIAAYYFESCDLLEKE